MDIEDRVQFGDLQKIFNSLGQPEKLKLTALISHGGEARHEFTDPRAVDVRQLGRGKLYAVRTVSLSSPATFEAGLAPRFISGGSSRIISLLAPPAGIIG